MFFLSYSLSFCCFFFFFFFFNHTPTTEIYTLSLTTLFRSHRSFEWGNLASMFVLDTRQYRDKYACGGDFGEVCDERDDPARSILGMEQEEWLHEGLRSAAPPWKLIAQSVVMANLDFDNTVANFDQWD